MAREFDPYHKWLGIPPEDQPPHYYRLLAIRLYEDDPQVIEAAADRQMTFLRRYQSGEYGENARRLLGEVSRARLCLLKPATKSKYDAKLQSQLEELAANGAVSDDDAQADETEQDLISEIDIKVSERPATPLWRQPAVIVGSVTGMLLVVVAMIFLNSAQPPAGEKLARGGNGTLDNKKNSSKNSSSDPNSDETESTSKRPRKDFQARPLASGDKPAWPTLMDADDPSEAGSQTGKADPKSKGPKPLSKDNLISKIDLKRDVVQGAWKIDGGELISPTGARDRIQIPTKVPESYTLTVVAERESDAGFGLSTYLPVGKSLVLATVDGWNGETSGLELIDNKEGDINETMTIGAFTQRGLNTLVYRVQPNQIAIDVNGQKVLEWTGDSQLFTIHPQYAVPRTGEIGFAVFGTPWRIQSITLVPKPQAKVAANSSAGEPPAFEPLGFKPPVITSAENLIKNIDPMRDAVQGTWKVDGGVLIAPAGGRDRIRIPGKVPSSYTLTIIGEKDQPGGYGLSPILPVGKGQAIATIEGWNGRACGLEVIDGKQGDANETTTYARLIKPGLNTFICRVTPDSVRVEVNGRKAIDWKGDSTKLALHSLYAMPKTDELGIAGGWTEWRISGIKLESGDSKGSPSNKSPNVVSSPTFVDALQGSLVTEKVAAPDKTALDAAKKTIRELFKNEYVLAKKQDGKIALATLLLSKGQEANSDHAANYVMLSEAAEMAAAAGQLGVSWDAIAALSERFDVNRLLLMEKTAKTASAFAKAPDEMRILVTMYATLFNEATRVNDFETASRVIQASATAVRQPTYSSLKDQVVAAGKRISSLKEAFDGVKSAREKLQTNPNDPVASLAWGRFLCFHKNNWADGLPLLAAGIDPVWSPLAQRELGLNEMSPPPESAAIVKLGDDWWAAAEKEKEPLRSIIRDHAAESYLLALGGLTGLEKLATQQKADRIFGSAKFTESLGEEDGVVIAPAEVNPGNFFTVEFWVSTTATTGTLTSKRIGGGSSISLFVEDSFAGLGGHADDYWQFARGTTSINDGRWHHIAGVKLGRELLLFVDGKKEAQVEGLDAYSSAIPWKVGQKEILAPISARFCRFRLSKTPRYLIPFIPEKQYLKDSDTLFMK